MTDKDLYRLGLIQRVSERPLLQREAARLMAISVHHVQRLLRLFTAGGPAALASARRGRPANNRLPEDFRCLVLDIIRQHYADFRPKFATEKLAERHGLRVSSETVRNWMIADGL